MSGRCGRGYIVQLGRSGGGYICLCMSQNYSQAKKETIRLVVSDAKS